MEIPKITHNGLSFVNVTKPNLEQLKFLNKEFGFSMLNLEDYLYKTQIPKIEVYDGYTLLVLDTPYTQQPVRSNGNKPGTNNSLVGRMFPPRGLRRKRILLGEVDFFIGKDYVVVLHDERTPQINHLFELCKHDENQRKELMGKGAPFLFYRITDQLVDTSIACVDELNNTIESIDEQLEEKSSAAVIEDISITRRNIVVFETMIKPTLPLFTDLEKGKYTELGGNMIPYWSNILDHVQKVWDRLEDSKELIEGIARSHESMLTVRTNEIIKVLTMFTAIMLPLTFVASLYGMNVELPFGQLPGAFFMLLAIMTGLAVLMILYFRSRDWL
ncbi:MAG: magnesium transporter CorA family protein [Patescibacteria group bacterium]